MVTQNAPGKSRRKVAISYAAAIEMGPSDALKGPLTQILTAVDEKLVTSIMYTSMLLRGVNAEVTALSAAGKLWGQGLNIDLHAVNFQDDSKNSRQVLACLPPYPWNHSSRYWHDSAWGKTYRNKEHPRTDLLGMRVPSQDSSEPRWQNFVRLSEQPWLSDHRVQQIILYPGSCYDRYGNRGSQRNCRSEPLPQSIEACNVLFKRSLVIPSGDGAIETAMHLRPLKNDTKTRDEYDFRMFSQATGEAWEENCSGTIAILYMGRRR